MNNINLLFLTDSPEQSKKGTKKGTVLFFNILKKGGLFSFIYYKKWLF
jgi:hypothetical protein